MRTVAGGLLWACLLGVSAATSSGSAADWPQWLGPNRNGVYNGEIAATFPAGGPPLIWEREVGAGFANPVVARGRLILFHRVGDEERAEALDASSGKTIWTFSYESSYRDSFGFDPGPRASPVVSGGQVYLFGAQGVLHCLEFATGKKIWRVDANKDFAVRKGFFGAAGTPLVEGSRLFLNVGGPDGAGLAAFDKDTGRLLWKSHEDEASYSSPVAARFGDETHILFFTRTGLVGVLPESGEVLYQKRWRSRSNSTVNAATPLVSDDIIFLSASYGTGATALRLEDGRRLTSLWEGEGSLDNHYATSVLHKGVLYGYHGRQEYGPTLRAVELVSGKLLWEEKGFGAGSILCAGSTLVLLREDGELVLARATPANFQILARAKILSGTVRAYPALANGVLYARNNSKIVAVRIAAP